MTSHILAPSAGSPPQSVEQITRMAQEYEYSPTVPLKYWLRTAAALNSQASIYEREGHEELAYLILFRHAQLVLVNLTKHPGAKDKQNQAALVNAEKEVQQNLLKLEVLKPVIRKRYERYQEALKHRKLRSPRATPNAPSIQPQPPDPALAGVAEPLEAGRDKDLAVKLARTEISRRATARRALRETGISSEEERTRRTAGVWGDWENALQQDGQQDSESDLSERIQNVQINANDRRPAGQSRKKLTKNTAQPPLASSSTSSYKYPTVPRQKASDIPPPPPQKTSREDTPPRIEAPLPPPKELAIPGAYLEPSPPPRPDKISPTASPAPPLPAKVQVADNETDVRGDLEPSSYTFKPSAYLENGTPLRTVFLPPELRHHFLAIAAPNTERNLETCGILCGTLISNALFISRLLIPEQTSTSDTCETVNESAIFDYCDSEDLMMLGWIHTHPTQTCFMSSRDLHTHCGYQVMLPESFAIVCAPSKSPDWGVFRLTDPPGLKTVLNCNQSGIFHPHGGTNIYTDALKPGHVYEAKGLEFETVDLRPDGMGF